METKILLRERVNDMGIFSILTKEHPLAQIDFRATPQTMRRPLSVEVVSPPMTNLERQ